MIIVLALLLVAFFILLIWSGINLFFNIGELIGAIAKRQKGQIIVHAIQLGLTVTVIIVALLFFIGGLNQ